MYNCGFRNDTHDVQGEGPEARGIEVQQAGNGTFQGAAVEGYTVT